ncbi:MAG: hypothetical protein K2Q06_15565, partial [Parvularculaceae bacterium]|nr:hypothetical protein [Parvularculaceae bacterium]
GAVETPDLRRVSGAGARARAGAGWAGVVARKAYEAQNVSQAPLAPAWVWLVLTLSALVGAWFLEGRRARPPEAI